MARVGEQAPLEPVRAGITPRELEVLRCIVLRLSNREIADRLVVSVRTVESHVPALLTKLGATTRRELATRGATLLEQPATATGSGLPVALNRFVGRARELGEVAALLSSGRLVTLTGPAGMGKTRLALEVGRASGERYDGGVRVVDLTPARQDAEIADRVLAALGVAQVPGQPALDTLANDGPGRPVLVVLDNCEHVLAGCAVVVAKLLGHWPSAGVLATSREPLGVSGETVYPVRPLAVPDPEITQLADVVSSEAVQPLADRAGRAGAGFEVTDANAAAVALLCRRLDGLPLALELLAPRLRTFTAGQLVERLDDRLDLLATGAPGVPSRHRTLRRAIDWSFESLSGPERSLLTGLAIFAGSFSIDAVEAVCTESNVVETLPLLVDRSLVVAVPAGATNRYRLLETLRAYAHERLDPQTERSLAGRHAHHFLEFAERAEPRLRSARAPEWLDRLRAEQDNLDAALQWALAHRPLTRCDSSRPCTGTGRTPTSGGPESTGPNALLPPTPRRPPYACRQCCHRYARRPVGRDPARRARRGCRPPRAAARRRALARTREALPRHGEGVRDGPRAAGHQRRRGRRQVLPGRRRPLAHRHRATGSGGHATLGARPALAR
jgi:predicted ATPase/DNA-binding CsgD family transcriptional regulator